MSTDASTPLVTRIAVCKTANAGKVAILRQTAIPLLRVRSDVWRMFTGIKRWSKPDARITMRKAGLSAEFYGLPYELWASCIEDSIDNIFALRRSRLDQAGFAAYVHEQISENSERRAVFSQAKATGKITGHPNIARKQRKILRKQPQARSQNLRLALTKNTYNARRDDLGRVWLSVATIAKGRRTKINLGTLPYDITGTINLIIRENGVIEVHSTVPEKPCKPRPVPPAGSVIGVDAGMSEVFATSEGEFLGVEQGDILKTSADLRRQKGRARGKLHSVARDHETKAAAAVQKGDLESARHHRAKARNLHEHNLSRVKLDTQTRVRRQHLRTLQYQSVHSLCDHYAQVVAENLVLRGGSKKASKAQNNRLSSWQRSSLKTALEAVTRRRGSTLTFVNPAYTSQQLSTCGHIGRRNFDVVYCATFGCTHRGERHHADVNAARNILARATDSDITLFTPYRQVKTILESRVSTTHPRHENSGLQGQSVSELPEPLMRLKV